MPMAELYAYLFKKKLVTPIFVRPRDGPSTPDFNPSKKCKQHFGAEGYTLEECVQLRYWIQDLINNKLIQFGNKVGLNVIPNPLPPHPDGNMNAITIVERGIPNFSIPTFLWKAMLRALAKESHIVRDNIGALSLTGKSAHSIIVGTDISYSIVKCSRHKFSV